MSAGSSRQRDDADQPREQGEQNGDREHQEDDRNRKRQALTVHLRALRRRTGWADAGWLRRSLTSLGAAHLAARCGRVPPPRGAHAQTPGGKCRWVIAKRRNLETAEGLDGPVLERSSDTCPSTWPGLASIEWLGSVRSQKGPLRHFPHEEVEDERSHLIW